MGSIFLGICLIALAIWMGFNRKKKRFNRTNQYGVQEFKSYEHAVGSDLTDKALGCLGGIMGMLAFFLILWGLYSLQNN